MRTFSLLRFAIVLLLVLDSSAGAQKLPDTTRLLRFPTTNGRQIVFCYAGELYTVAKEGGTARRLTSGPGYSSFPRFSADGTQLAFTSKYDGNTEVYVMPAEGGVPKRLTTTATLGRDDISDRMGPNNIVMTWENTKPLVVFRSRMKIVQSIHRPALHGGAGRASCRSNCLCHAADLSPSHQMIPRWLSTASSANSAPGNTIAAGMADDVWIHDFKTGATENLTNDEAQDICPMWGAGQPHLFLSDRDGRMNLFSTDLASKETKQLTTFKDFDIKFPSIGKDSIVFEQAGYIWRYDLASGQAARRSDRYQGRLCLRTFCLRRRVEKHRNRSAQRRMRNGSS